MRRFARIHIDLSPERYTPAQVVFLHAAKTALGPPTRTKTNLRPSEAPACARTYVWPDLYCHCIGDLTERDPDDPRHLTGTPRYRPRYWVWSSRTAAGELWLTMNMPEGAELL